MLITNSRKAINFDLDDSLLKKYYPSKNYKNGWRDIRNFLRKSNFIHRQYSGYVSKDCISMADVSAIVYNMSLHLKWLKKCAMEFDVTIVTDEYSFLDTIMDADDSKLVY